MSKLDKKDDMPIECGYALMGCTALAALLGLAFVLGALKWVWS